MHGPEKKSTRPTARVLRESFIANFQREGQEAALRLLDELADQFTCEQRGDYLMGEDDDAIDRSEALSAAGDLRQAAEQLRSSAQSFAESVGSDRRAMRLALAIADASAAAQPLADSLDSAVAAYLTTPPEEA
jgi:hypothetical protein